MDNHVMYFWDEEGEIALNRCCLCKHVLIAEGKRKCSYGFDCESGVCSCHVPIEKNKISARFANIRKELKNQIS